MTVIGGKGVSEFQLGAGGTVTVEGTSVSDLQAGANVTFEVSANHLTISASAAAATNVSAFGDVLTDSGSYNAGVLGTLEVRGGGIISTRASGESIVVSAQASQIVSGFVDVLTDSGTFNAAEDDTLEIRGGGIVSTRASAQSVVVSAAVGPILAGGTAVAYPFQLVGDGNTITVSGQEITITQATASDPILVDGTSVDYPFQLVAGTDVTFNVSGVSITINASTGTPAVVSAFGTMLTDAGTYDAGSYATIELKGGGIVSTRASAESVVVSAAAYQAGDNRNQITTTATARGTIGGTIDSAALDFNSQETIVFTLASSLAGAFPTPTGVAGADVAGNRGILSIVFEQDANGGNILSAAQFVNFDFVEGDMPVIDKTGTTGKLEVLVTYEVSAGPDVEYTAILGPSWRPVTTSAAGQTLSPVEFNVRVGTGTGGPVLPLGDANTDGAVYIITNLASVNTSASTQGSQAFNSIAAISADGGRRAFEWNDSEQIWYVI